MTEPPAEPPVRVEEPAAPVEEPAAPVEEPDSSSDDAGGEPALTRSQRRRRRRKRQRAAETAAAPDQPTTEDPADATAFPGDVAAHPAPEEPAAPPAEEPPPQPLPPAEEPPALPTVQAPPEDPAPPVQEPSPPVQEPSPLPAVQAPLPEPTDEPATEEPPVRRRERPPRRRRGRAGTGLRRIDPAAVPTKERSGRRRGLLFLVALLLLGTTAVLVATVLLREPDVGEAPRTPTGPAQRSQRTVLLQLRPARGEASGAALLSHDPGNQRASMTFIPTRVLTGVAGVGSVPFGRAVVLGGPAAAQGALGELMGVIVDHHWTVTPAALAAVIDSAGGITVNVDVDVIAPGPGGSSVILVRAGRQRLDGRQALTYAGYLARGEQQLAGVPRLQAVLDGLLAALPAPPALVATLGSLGSGSETDWTPQELAGFVTGMAQSRGADRISYDALPVVPIDTGGPQVTYRHDEVQTQELVLRTLAASVPPGRLAGQNRVILLNGVGRPGIAQSVQPKLAPHGFTLVRSGNANRFNYRQTVVLVPDATEPSLDRGRRVSELLGVPSTAVRINPQAQTVADVIVIIGRDYRP